MYTISNHFLTAEFSPIGAELIGLTEKETGISYVWNGDPKFWGRRAPLLFPIVGKLKNGSMLLHGKKYQMDQHGFIRDMPFTVQDHSESYISWECVSNEETKTKFPFDWKVVCTFTLQDNVLQVSTAVTNTSSENMLFSIGYHPAFRVPIDRNLSMEDYSLVFDKDVQV